MAEFVAFRKIPRLSRNIIITEKVDGTNAQVFIRTLGDGEVMPTDTPIVAVRGNLLIYAGSRTRWITPKDDNYGFARWVEANADDLANLGDGAHFGEWWGSGIQRRYGLTGDDKRFSLFNVGRWIDERRPACCGVVPTLYHGPFTMDAVEQCVTDLAMFGSKAAPGFMDPEGIIVFHSASNELFKKTLKKDAEPKSLAVRQTPDTAEGKG